MNLAAIAATILLTQTPAPMDMTKVGPLTRKVTKEDKQGIESAIKAADEAWKKGDMEKILAGHDFPIYMATDDSKGAFKGGEWTREQFVQMMGDMIKSMPKDLTMKHKLTTHFMSDTLAVVIDEPTMVKGGKELGSYKTAMVMVKKDGQWRFKSGVEAGWGDMPGPKGKEMGTR